MLSGPRLRDDSCFTHPLCEQHLADGVIDFVGTGEVEIFAFEIDAGAAAFLGESFGEVEGIGATDKVCQEIVELTMEFGVGFSLFPGFAEFFEGVHQCFGDIAPAIFAEASAMIGNSADGG